MPVKERGLVVFAKEPVPGRVKSRLSSVIGESNALSLYRAFLKDVHALTYFVPAHLRILAYDAFGNIPWYLYATFPHFVFYPQHGADLGARIEDVILYAKHMGARRIVIMGVDVPTLPAELVSESFERLKRCDYVLGPKMNGGLYLIGVNDWDENVFKDVAWDSKDVLTQLKDNMQKNARECHVLCDWCEIDRVEDLQACRKVFFSSRADKTAEAIADLFRAERDGARNNLKSTGRKT